MGSQIFLAALVLTSVSLNPGLLTADSYLGTRHNTIENKEVVMRSEEETVEAVIREKVAGVEEAVRREVRVGEAQRK